MSTTLQQPTKRRLVRSKYISSQEVHQIVRQQLGAKLVNNYKFHSPDGKYYCPSVEYAQKVIQWSSVDRNKWVKERFDCDDFALVLKADFAKCAYKSQQIKAPFCFGIVWGQLGYPPGPHAINWMINDDRKLRFIEPQSDQIYFPRSNEHGIWFMYV